MVYHHSFSLYCMVKCVQLTNDFLMSTMISDKIYIILNIHINYDIRKLLKMCVCVLTRVLINV